MTHQTHREEMFIIKDTFIKKPIDFVTGKKTKLMCRDSKLANKWIQEWVALPVE